MVKAILFFTCLLQVAVSTARAVEFPEHRGLSISAVKALLYDNSHNALLVGSKMGLHFSLNEGETYQTMTASHGLSRGGVVGIAKLNDILVVGTEYGISILTWYEKTLRVRSKLEIPDLIENPIYSRYSLGPIKALTANGRMIFALGNELLVSEDAGQTFRVVIQKDNEEQKLKQAILRTGLFKRVDVMIQRFNIPHDVMACDNKFYVIQNWSPVNVFEFMPSNSILVKLQLPNSDYFNRLTCRENQLYAATSSG